MSETLVLAARLAASPTEVYRALTDPCALRTWLAEHAEVDLPAGRYQFWGRHTPQGATARQRLLAAEPDRLLSFTWTLDGRQTTTELRLQPEVAQATMLELRQDGMPTMQELMAPKGRRDGLHSLHTFWPLALANLAEHLEGRPLTSRADFSPDRPREIRIALAIGAPPDQVFASLIDPTQVERWFGWKPEIEPHVGGRITLGVDGKIFELHPGKRLAYADDQGAIVRWELAGDGGKTRLTFVQSGFRDDELDNAAQHEAGWLAGLAELRRLHELGDAWTPLAVEPSKHTDKKK
jgi:uncharacterized protein YndB with AHSA1/START domain